MKKQSPLSSILSIIGLASLCFLGSNFVSADGSGHMLKEACTITYISRPAESTLKSSYDLGKLMIRFGTFCGQSGFWINEKPFIDTLGVIDVRSTDSSVTFITTGMEITCDTDKLASFWPRKAEAIPAEAQETLKIIATLPNSSPYELAKGLGYTRKSDRFALAKNAGIKNYRGTAAQNLKIQRYMLIEKGVLPADGKVAPTTTAKIVTSPARYTQMKQESVSNLVQHWDYYWPLHREGLAQEFIPAVAEKQTRYQGSRSQNSKIGSELLKKVEIVR